MKVSYSCPLIDEILELVNLPYLLENEKVALIEKLEKLRQINKDLRAEAELYKSLYNATLFYEYEFNPEVLPNE